MDKIDAIYDKLNKLFTDSFIESYKKVEIKNKSVILNFVSQIYKKWLHTSLFDDITITPFQILEDIRTDDLRIDFPLIKNKRTLRFDFVKTIYNTKNHPIVEDLKTIVDYYAYADCINEFTYKEMSDLTELYGKVSLWDIQYFENLVDLALELNLLSQMASINTFKAELGSNYISFFNEPSFEIIKILTKKNIHFISESLGVLSDTDSDEIKKRLYLAISEDENIKDFFDNILQFLDIDFVNNIINSIILGMVDEKDNPKNYIRSVLDKEFSTPLGYYLKIICPIYTKNSTMEDDMLELLEDIKNPFESENIGAYSFDKWNTTKLGKEVFAETLPESAYKTLTLNGMNIDILNNILECANNFNPIDIINSTDVFSSSLIDEYNTKFSPIAELKIKLESAPKLYKIIHIHTNTNLKDLRKFIVKSFILPPNTDYKFYTGMQETIFTEIPSVAKNANHKDCSKITIESFNFSPKDKFKFKAFLTNTFEEVFVIEYKKTLTPAKRTNYPCVIKDSIGFANMNDMFLDSILNDFDSNFDDFDD